MNDAPRSAEGPTDNSIAPRPGLLWRHPLAPQRAGDTVAERPEIGAQALLTHSGPARQFGDLSSEIDRRAATGQVARRIADMLYEYETRRLESQAREMVEKDSSA